MASDREAFLRVIAEQPADRTARLAFADFLEENGDAPRAEFVRTQVEAETVHPNSLRARELLFRARDLFAAHWPDWWAPVCTAVGLPEPYRPRGVRGWLSRQFDPSGTKHNAPYNIEARDLFTVHVALGPDGFGAPAKVAFAGGFPEALTFNGQLYRSGELLRKWPEAAPLAALDLRGVVGRDWRAIDGPHLAGVRTLGLTPGATTALEVVADSPHLPQLEELHLAPDRSNFHWPAEQYRAFADSPLPARVRRLDVTVSTPEETQALRRAPLGNVTALTVRAAPTVTDAVEVDDTALGVAEWFSLPYAFNIDELVLDPVTAHAFVWSGTTALSRVRRLHLELSPSVRMVPPSSPLSALHALVALEDLALVAEGWPAEWVTELAENPCVGRLRHLRLGGNMPPSEDAIHALLRLGQALDPDRLETLRVGSRVCNAEPVRAALTERFGARARFG